MADRIAIKRLSATDCTLFDAVFKKPHVVGKQGGKQKGINLNADVLTGQFYPNLAVTAAAADNEIALAISVYGPAAKGAHKLSRKIIKGIAYKNWRLNGETIHGPPDDASRYDDIKRGDFAIIIFKGEASPSGMDLIVVSQENAADAALHSSLVPLFRNKSMIAVTPEQIAAAASNAGVPDTHPVHIAAADPEMDAALEDAAQGGLEGTGKLLKNKRGRKLTGSDLAKAKAKAELTGQEGEGLVNGYLAAKVAAGELASYTWAAAENAVAPFDFETLTASGQRTLIDAKTTSGPFDNVIHLSLSEIIEASGAVPYRIYRVFDLNDDGGKLSISDDIRPLAQHLKTIHEQHMPNGVRVDGFSVTTAALKWGSVEFVERPDDDDVA